MSKLSEMGREIWLFNESAGSTDGLSIDCSDSYRARAYSMEERRELVRAVLKAAWDYRATECGNREPDWQWEEELFKKWADKFIKEQEL